MFCSPVYSGPDDTTNYLINNSPSLMDFGIFKINVRLASNASNNASYKATLSLAEYYYDDNNIVISRSFYSDIKYSDTKVTEIQALLSCKIWISEIRIQGGVDVDTGQLDFYLENSRYADNFTHEGYSKKNSPEDLLASIDKKIKIYCTSFYEDDSKSMSMTLTAPLIGNSYSVEKKLD
jgi:hypothetical protein